MQLQPLVINKKWIETNLFTKTGSMNNRISKNDWWSNRNLELYRQQIETVLPESSNIFEKVYFIYHGLASVPLCKCGCGNKVKFQQFKSGYRDYYSIECSTKCSIRNKKISDHHKKNPPTGNPDLFRTEEFKQKSKETKLKKYGNTTYNNKEKAKSTNMIKYGKTVAPVCKRKSSRPPLEILKNMNNEMSCVKMASKLNVTVKTIYDWFESYGEIPIYYTPDNLQMQKNIVDEISKFGFEIVENDRKQIKPYELDLWIPEKKLAIELNGCYWHSNDKNRHLDKLKLCEEKGIRLIQIWDFEWLEKKEIVLSILKNSLGINENRIGSSKTTMVHLDSKTYRKFLEENHIQGYARASIKKGLYYKGELISVIGLSKPRFGTGDLEITRFCNKTNWTVHGSFSKLLKGIEGHLVTYADRRLFTGEVYSKNGFEFISDTPPGYFWWKSGERKSRYQTQMKGEREIMESKGWTRIWDCGHKKFIKIQPQPQKMDRY